MLFKKKQRQIYNSKKQTFDLPRNRYFVELPYTIGFERFEHLVESIKNNCNINMFNAAPVTLARYDRVMNFIAVCSKDCDE
jgi:hypothetical protein